MNSRRVLTRGCRSVREPFEKRPHPVAVGVLREYLLPAVSRNGVALLGSGETVLDLGGEVIGVLEP